MLRPAICLLVSSLIFMSCGSGDPPTEADELPADVIEYELLDSTIQLDSAATGALVSMDDDFTLRFSSVPASLETLEPKQVLLVSPTSATPSGLLLLVTEVEEAGSELIVRGGPAPLQMAFERLKIRATRRVTGIDDNTPELIGPGGQRQSLQQALTLPGQIVGDLDFFLFNGDGDPDTLDDQARVTGKLGGGFEFTIGIEFDWKGLLTTPLEALECGFNAITDRGCDPKDLIPDVGLDFDVDANAIANFDVKGAAFRGFSEEYVIGTLPLGLIPLPPVWFKADVVVLAHLEGEASSQFELSAGATATMSLGTSISTKDGIDLRGPTSDFTTEETVARATLRARAYVDIGPELKLKIYGIAGPKAGIFAFAELNANNDQNPCYTFSGGLKGEAGIEVTLPDLPLIGTIKIFDWEDEFPLIPERTFLEGDCELVGGPGASPILDPVSDDGGWAGDPREAVFQAPAFDPWAISFNEVVDEHPVEAFNAQVEWTDLTPTIDGRFVIAGSDVIALSKVDRDGNLLWARSYEAVENWPDSFINEVMVGRTVQGTSPDLWVVGHPYVVMKVTQDGALRWAQRFLPPDTSDRWLRFTGAAEAPDGGLYVAGNYGDDSTTQSATDAWLLRLDRNGEVLWSKRFGDPMIGDMLRSAVAYPDGGVVVTGSRYDDVAVDWWPWVARFAPDGTLVFARHYPVCGTLGGEAHAVTAVIADDGDILLGGGGIGNSGRASVVMKVNPTAGDIAFTGIETVASGLGLVLTELAPLPTTGYLGVGTYDGFSAGEDFWVGGLSGLAEILWAVRIGGTDLPETDERENDAYPAVVLTKDGGAIVAGASQGFGEDGILVVKVPAKDGAITFSGATNATTSSLGGTGDGICLGDETWAISPVDLEVEKTDQPLTVVPVTRTVTTHTP